MKIALLGYGKMGRLIEQIATANGHHIVACFSQQLGTPQQRPQELAKADIAIDFSDASAVIPNLELCISMDKPLVIGTTGWDELLEAVREKVNQSANIGCLFAPNFSLGICLFRNIASHAASLFEPFSHYDVSGIECHHKQKKDHPSGTAKTLTNDLLQQMPRLESIPFSSVRCGHIPGTHTILFDSPDDTITLTHTARTRDGFAYGALKAAEWLLPRKGFFSLDDMMQDYLKGARQ